MCTRGHSPRDYSFQSDPKPPLTISGRVPLLDGSAKTPRYGLLENRPYRKRAPKSCAHTLSCALENSGPEKSRILNTKKRLSFLKATLWAEHRSSHAESRFPLPVQPGLGFALGLRAAGTIARLLLQGSARYVAAQQELRTTGVRRSGRIIVLI